MPYAANNTIHWVILLEGTLSSQNKESNYNKKKRERLNEWLVEWMVGCLVLLVSLDTEGKSFNVKTVTGLSLGNNNPKVKYDCFQSFVTNAMLKSFLFGFYNNIRATTTSALS